MSETRKQRLVRLRIERKRKGEERKEKERAQAQAKVNKNTTEKKTFPAERTPTGEEGKTDNDYKGIAENNSQQQCHKESIENDGKIKSENHRFWLWLEHPYTQNIIAIFVAVINVVLLWIGVSQISAAKEGVRDIRDQFEKENRPMLQIDSIGYPCPENCDWPVTFKIVNIGKVPARIIEASMMVRFEPITFNPVVPYKAYEDFEDTDKDLFIPNDRPLYLRRFLEFTPAKIDMASGERLFLFAYGFVHYKDLFSGKEYYYLFAVRNRKRFTRRRDVLRLINENILLDSLKIDSSSIFYNDPKKEIAYTIEPEIDTMLNEKGKIGIVAIKNQHMYDSAEVRKAWEKLKASDSTFKVDPPPPVPPFPNLPLPKRKR
ncbi:hypothetical protein [Pollutibacter soli]|uniref:hypothetical protein n=1 Tax=Pollutibacter soli TaxID=3034157 RepID=UPI003013B8EF